MFPLRFWTRPPEDDDVTRNTEGLPVGSFLSWGPLGNYFPWRPEYQRRQPFVTLVGDGVEVRHDDGVVQYQSRVTAIPADGSRRLALFRVNYVDPALRSDRRDRVQERRSFRASMADGRLRIVLDTPEVIRLSPASFETLTSGDDGSFLLTLRDRSRTAPVSTDQMQIAFPQLGPRIQNELYGVLGINTANCPLSVTSHTGEQCYALGDGFRVGHNAAAILRVTRFPVPWGIVLTLVALAAGAGVWTRRHYQDSVAILVISAAELLLAIRLLIAFEAAVLDWQVASAVWESLVVYALLPLVLRAAWSYRVRSRGVMLWVAALAAGPAVLVFVALAQAGVGITSAVLASLVVFVAPVAIGAAAEPLLLRIERFLVSPWRLVVFAAIVVGGRFLLWLGLGWKERAWLGADLALSVVYLPAMLLFFAGVWGLYRTIAPATSMRRLVGVTVGIGLCAAALLAGIPYLVSDSGGVFVHSPAIAALFALPWLARPRGQSFVLALPLVAMIVGHVSALTLSVVDSPDGGAAYQRALTSREAADAYFVERFSSDRNAMRLKGMTAPEELVQAGTSTAEGLVAQRRILDRFNGRGLWGAGYLNRAAAVFRETHVNDNLSSIHLLAPFGLAGAASFMALLAALALLPVAARGGGVGGAVTPIDAIDQRAALGVLALWTFCFASVYMIAANVGLVLFTGKNVYLLAAASKSDALEGGALLLITLLALAPLPTSRPAASPAEEMVAVAR